MGYNIGIGEAKIEYWADDDIISVTAASASHNDAPDLGKGDISGKGNYRYPSYTAFSNWVDATGLRETFYELNEEMTERRKESGFPNPDYWQMRGGHPGCVPLTKEKYDAVKGALDKWKKDHPDAIMPTPENTQHLQGFEEDHVNDYTLGRLVWFEFWMKWALENCKMPVIYNS